jgi:hypothetical protein
LRLSLFLALQALPLQGVQRTYPILFQVQDKVFLDFLSLFLLLRQDRTEVFASLPPHPFDEESAFCGVAAFSNQHSSCHLLWIVLLIFPLLTISAIAGRCSDRGGGFLCT